MSDVKSNKCTVYIDEAGDLGINRGTKWFVITGVIVPKDNEKQIRDVLQQAKTKFNLKEIHMRKLGDFYKSAYIVSQLREQDFTTVNVLMDTDKCPLKDSIKTYNFMCRFLLERVSWFVDDNHMSADIMLSSRGTSRDKELIQYIDKLISYPSNEIRGVFDKVSSKTAATWDMLQLADICATSMFRSYEVNAHGFIVPCFMSNLKDKIYHRNGKIDKYGLKFYLDNMKPSKDYFEKHRICNIKK